MKTFRIFILALILLMTTNCKLAFRALLGVDVSPDFITDKKIDRKAKRYGIPKESLFTLDLGTYGDSILAIRDYKINELEQDDSLLIQRIKNNAKNDVQPVQVRYFNSEGESIFKMVNCFIDPPIPMKWNVDGSLDEFPPKPIDELKEDIDHDLTFFLPMITDREGNKITLQDIPEATHYAIVFWNNFFIRPSKRLIRQIRRYDRKKGEGKTYFLFVNNHNAHLFNYLSDEDKIKVIEELEKN